MTRRVLDGLDLAVRQGEFVALLGRSGSGKSTLLRILAGLDGDIDGQSTVDGTVSVAFQQPRLLPWRKVWRNVVLGLHRTDDPRGIARRALAEVQLADRADAWPLTLSGGEAQRVSLARALVREPDLLLLDEPFAALDALTRMAMHRLVASCGQRHRPAVLLVTHDVDEALVLADRVLVLDAGRIVAEHVVTEPPAQAGRTGPAAHRSTRRPGSDRKMKLSNPLTLLGLFAVAAHRPGRVRRRRVRSSSSAPVPTTVSAAQLKGVTLRVGDQAGNSAAGPAAGRPGELDNLPYKIQWATFTSGPPMLQADAAGAIDIGEVGNTPPIFAAAANDKIDVVAAEQSPVGDTILVPANSPIHTLADLKGKTIAVAQGSSANGTLLTTLNKAGLSPADVKLGLPAAG